MFYGKTFTVWTGLKPFESIACLMLSGRSTGTIVREVASSNPVGVTLSFACKWLAFLEMFQFLQ